MNIDIVTKQLSNIISGDSIERVKGYDELLRCSISFQGSAYQVLYVDCGSDWRDAAQTPQSFEKYLESRLTSDYYSQNGPIQWNYYYAFLIDKVDAPKVAALKQFIEEDKLFARKLVVTPDQLTGWLKALQRLSLPSDSSTILEPSVIWREKLAGEKLDCVFLDTPFVKGVAAYLAGNPIQKTKEKTEKKRKNFFELTIDQLISLNLGDSRLWPSQKRFSWGKVNLIHGVNGTGKTSLLEGIEILMTGDTLRNPISSTEKEGISAMLRENNDTFRPPASKPEVKQRMAKWYAVDQPHSHIVSLFNKYNFFNSDAAFIFSNDNQSLREAFETIALGPDVNALEKRMDRYLEEFQKEFRSLKKQINTDGRILESESRLLKELGLSDTRPEKFGVEVKREAKRLKFRKIAKTAAKQYFQKLSKDATTVNTVANEILANIRTFEVGTPRMIKAWRALLTKARDKLLHADQELEKLEQDTIETQNRLLMLEGLQAAFLRLADYFAHSNIQRLPELSDQIARNRNELESSYKLLKLAQSIDDEWFSSLKPNDTVKSIETNYTARFSKLQLRIKKLQADRDARERQLDEVRKIVAEIKAAGISYIHNHQNSTECPLCHTTFAFKELEDRIRRSSTILKNSTQLQESAQALEAAKKLAKTYQLQNTSLKILRSLAADLSSETFEEVPIRTIRQTINRLDKRIIDLTNEATRLDRMNSKFERSQLSATEFLALKDKTGMKDVKSMSEFRKRRAAYQAETNKLKKSLKELKEKSISNRKRYHQSLQGINISPKIGNPLNALDAELGKYSRAVYLLNNLETIASLDQDISLGQQAVELKGFLSLVQRYEDVVRQSLANAARLKAASKTASLAQARLRDSQGKLKRAEVAISTLANLKNNHSSSKYLRDFMDKNRGEILDILKLIHKPEEFVDIYFKDDGTIMLTRNPGKKTTSISEISTGQRAALAIAVFLVLSKKLRNGPNLILFDDPVVNIDDMNVLTFFDYLREIAIHGKRQIFFATANEDLAFLFAQKFKFLADEFCEFHLKRNPAKSKIPHVE